VRGEFRQRLREVEIVGELRAFLLLPVANARLHPAAGPKILAQAADQLRVLGEAFGEDRPRAVERVFDGRDRVGLEESLRLTFRVALRMGEERLRQGLEAVFAPNLRLRATLGLIREIEVLEQRLRIGLVDFRFKRRVELPLLADRIEDRLATVLELAQIAQPLFERAQLRIVERPRRLLAIAGDERHRRPASGKRRPRGGRGSPGRAAP
jgi:hypothetical protein